MDGFLFQASVYLAAAVIAVPIAARLGLGSVLGYLLAGIIIGPILHLVAATDDLRHFAEFGVVMMLFIGPMIMIVAMAVFMIMCIGIGTNVD